LPLPASKRRQSVSAEPLNSHSRDPAGAIFAVVSPISALCPSGFMIFTGATRATGGLTSRGVTFNSDTNSVSLASRPLDHLVGDMKPR
jgi:hypothetical protein